MKVKKLETKNSESIQFQALKISNEKRPYINSHLKSQSIKTLLNKLFHIIVKYDIHNKNILFVGFPTYFSKTLTSSNHLKTPTFRHRSSYTANKDFHFNSNKSDLKKTRLNSKLKKNIDLIIVYNSTSNSAVITESYLSNLPVIGINKKIDLCSSRRNVYSTPKTYNLVYEKNEHSSFIFSFLESTLAYSKNLKILNFSNVVGKEVKILPDFDNVSA